MLRPPAKTACLISSRQNDERRRQVCRLGRDIRRDLPKAEQTHTYSLLFVSDPMESTSAISAIGNGQKAVSMGPTSPCAGCKFLRRKCQPDCVFAPYFPADQPQKFINVHKVFGASNVTKILNDLQPHQRQDAVTSLAYEAETRLQDKVYGCVGIVSVLQYRLVHLNHELSKAWAELLRWKAAAAAMAEVGDANQGEGWERAPPSRRVLAYSAAEAAEDDDDEGVYGAGGVRRRGMRCRSGDGGDGSVWGTLR
ncbi:hypothetical protein HPP92_004518 [Vanilla planifolia]|uniref:LOB domain-containing protein n=1 Tax=Vanilla planifolia TaxID=51239 RepID=A0A835S970_VANPL|nr:hypothetical protein HPP92_004518 [Vanilla planifolia]